jgi:hypothetical protein
MKRSRVLQYIDTNEGRFVAYTYALHETHLEDLYNMILQGRECEMNR